MALLDEVNLWKRTNIFFFLDVPEISDVVTDFDISVLRAL